MMTKRQKKFTKPYCRQSRRLPWQYSLTQKSFCRLFLSLQLPCVYKNIVIDTTLLYLINKNTFKDVHNSDLLRSDIDVPILSFRGKYHCTLHTASRLLQTVRAKMLFTNWTLNKLKVLLPWPFTPSTLSHPTSITCYIRSINVTYRHPSRVSEIFP